jgi:hypothetical protein
MVHLEKDWRDVLHRCNIIPSSTELKAVVIPELDGKLTECHACSYHRCFSRFNCKSCKRNSYAEIMAVLKLASETT